MTTTDPKDKVILQTATLTMALAIMRIMDGGCRDDGVVVAMIEEVSKTLKRRFPKNHTSVRPSCLAALTNKRITTRNQNEQPTF